MKLLITSDVHGHFDRLEQVIKRHHDVDLHINAGDMTLHPKHYESLNLITVKGNNDYGIDLPLERIIEFKGLRILLVHGHKEMVKFGLNRLKLKAKLLSVNLCIFGHTHKRYEEVDQGIHFINPGALCDGEGSYAIFEDNQTTWRGL